ncbi:class A sortase [Enterococcus alishanensis]|uniref:Class A sortase n=1 Tax=Enterococcus alishanensis TaxID=1303817 RepID=A0ABS6TE79_9ENTE|nr:class A sortase [Enterococcus alishanensis]MBV7391134.1 class A sortase [Enterococcus alishanensis]
MTKKQKKSNNLYKIIILLLLYVGTFMLFFPLFKKSFIVYEATTAQFKEVTQLTKVAKIPFEPVDAISFKETLAAVNQPDFSSIGSLQIDSLQLTTPIFAGLDQTQMIYGAGSMYPARNPAKENLVLLGHHLGVGDILFGRLNNIKKNAEIRLRYLGKNYTYQVFEKKEINETDLNVLKTQNKAMLTLITCDQPTATNKRIIVQAKLVNNKKNTIKKIEKKANKWKLIRKNVKFKWVWLPMIVFFGINTILSWFIIKKV